VILVALYALAFLAALVFLKGQAIRARSDPAAPAASAPASPPAPSRRKPDREELLSGAGLDPSARPGYQRRLAQECCDCGCELTLEKCLAGDQKCARSAELAEKALDSAGSP
jgi:hypothetical protein